MNPPAKKVTQLNLSMGLIEFDVVLLTYGEFFYKIGSRTGISFALREIERNQDWI